MVSPGLPITTCSKLHSLSHTRRLQHRWRRRKNACYAHHLKPLPSVVIQRDLPIPRPIRRPAILPHNRRYRAVVDAVSRLNILWVSPGMREGFLTLRAIEEASWCALTCTGFCHRRVPGPRRVPFIPAPASLLGQNPPATAPAVADDAEAGDE